MSARRIFAFSTISALVATLAMGCSSATTEEEEEVSVDDITPDSAQTVWALAELCDGNITRHSAVKAQETAQGVVRWQCGDREGVDGELDRGQEYCEYMAISDGKKVTTASQIVKGKPLQASSRRSTPTSTTRPASTRTARTPTRAPSTASSRRPSPRRRT
jgi:hypothetical protein